MAGFSDKVYEVNIVFPVPGEAEIRVHVSIVKACPEIVEGMKAEMQKAD